MPQTTDPSLIPSGAFAPRTPSASPVEPLAASDASATPQTSPAPDTAKAPEQTDGAPAADKPDNAPGQGSDSSAKEAALNRGLPPAQDAAVRPGPAAKLFEFLAATGPIAALLFLIAQLLPGLCLRGPSVAQSRIQDALGQFPGSGSGIFASISGTPAPDLSPLYLWFMKGATSLSHLVFPEASPTTLLLCGAALCAVALVLGIWCLGTFAGGGRMTAFAACAVFLSTLSVCGALQMALPEVLSASLMLFSLLFLYAGWMRPRAPFFLLAGYLFAALAAISGGPAGVVFPLLTSLLFLFWRGSFCRAGAIDGAVGFGAMLALVLGWFSWISLNPQTSGSLSTLFDFYRSQWNQSPFLQVNIAETILKWVFFSTLPWGFIALFLPWERVYRLPALCWKNRTQDPGIGWIWCATLGALVTAAFFGPAFSAMTLPIAALASLLAGRAVLNLSARRSRIFFGLVSLFFILIGLPVLCAPLFPWLIDWMPSLQNLAPDCVLKAMTLPGLYLAGIACLVFSALLLFVINKRFPAGGLLTVLLLVTATALPIDLFTLPKTLPVQTVAPAMPEPSMPVAPAAKTPPAGLEAPDAPQTSPTPSNEPVAPADIPEPAISAVPQENIHLDKNEPQTTPAIPAAQTPSAEPAPQQAVPQP